MKGFTAKRAGFTLIEALVAVAIITIAIAGPMYTANRALVAAQVASDQLTASYLAQEGIEYVRLMRDDAFLNAYKNDPSTASTQGWNDFLASGSGDFSIWQCSKNSAKKACTLDTSTFDPAQPANSLTSCKINPPGNNCTPLYLNTSNNTYTQSVTPTPTPFTRTIQASDISPTEEVATSTVTWSSHNSNYSVTVTDHLTPWQ